MPKAYLDGRLSIYFRTNPEKLILHEFFALNRPLILFAYGQVFFVMGLAAFLQSRRYSHLQLARDLRWLAAFGILHGLHEWGDVFIPIQEIYLPTPYVDLLRVFQVILLALSFACLMAFGTAALCDRWPYAGRITPIVTAGWLVLLMFVIFPTTSTTEHWLHTASIWARYLLGLPGGLLAAYGLRYQAQTRVAPLQVPRIYRSLRVAGLTLVAYAILGGLIVQPGPFFPANVLNSETIETISGIPIQVFRSVAGLVLAVSVIRGLELFEVEIKRLIEGMEIERIQADQREQIGQEIHDGAIQAIYAASLMLETAQQRLGENASVAPLLDRTQQALKSAVTDLRRYMMSLRADVPVESLETGLRRLAEDPRFGSLLEINLVLDGIPDVLPIQTGYILAIVQESLANAARHANARHVAIRLSQQPTGWELQIHDDGQGFSEGGITPGFGLRSMRDRARLLGGQLTVQSQPKKGTQVTLVMPGGNAS